MSYVSMKHLLTIIDAATALVQACSSLATVKSESKHYQYKTKKSETKARVRLRRVARVRREKIKYREET